jgi:bifunctional non-homologous end joining protein LigD
MPKKSITESRIVGFIESMECRPVAKIPEGLEWTYEIKLDGYRLEVVRAGGKTTLYSRRQNPCPYRASLGWRFFVKHL